LDQVNQMTMNKKVI